MLAINAMSAAFSPPVAVDDDTESGVLYATERAFPPTTELSTVAESFAAESVESANCIVSESIVDVQFMESTCVSPTQTYMV